MRYLFIISALFLTACGQPGFQTAPSDPRTITGVDPAFAPYVNEYISYKGRGLDYDIPIQFSPDLGGNTVGICTRWSNGYRQIQIDKDYWDNWLDEGERREVIAHELGHCDLNRDHTVHQYPALSIMDPYVFSLTPSSIAGYMSELFNPAPITHATTLASMHDDCVNDIEVK